MLTVKSSLLLVALTSALAACGAAESPSVSRVGLKPIDVRDSAAGSGSGNGTAASGGAVGVAGAKGASGASGATGASGPGAGPSPNALALFGSTAYPLLTKWCAACHSGVQSPFFAAADVQSAYNAILVSQKVDFANIAASRVVLRLNPESHNCPVDIGCAAAATQLEAALTSWAKQANEAAPNTAQLPATTTFKLTEAAAKTVPGNNPADVMLFMPSDFKIVAPMEMVSNPAVTGTMMIDTPATATSVTNLNTAKASTTLGTATLNFTVASAAAFLVQVEVNGAAAASSSFYLNMDAAGLTPFIFTPNGALFGFVNAAATAAGAPLSFNLAAGAHTLVIEQRQASAKFDKVVISAVPTFDPTSAQPATRNVNLLTFDLSSLTKVAGTELTVEVQDFSQNAYLFTNPTLVVPSGSVHVANLELLVNGQFNPQEATYTTIDATIAAPGGVLSTASLVAVKDKGNAADEFSFAFGTIEAK